MNKTYKQGNKLELKTDAFMNKFASCPKIILNEVPIEFGMEENSKY